MAGKHIIMLVDDDETSLTLGKEILEERYTIYPFNSGAQFFTILSKVLPSLVLLDIEMPEMDGYEVIRRLKNFPGAAEIPVIFLTAYSDPGDEFAGLKLGAIDYISKPFSPPLLLQRIENHLLIASQKQELKRFNQSLREMVSEQIHEIRSLQNAVLSAVSEVVEFRDTMSDGHIDRITRYLRLMLNALREQDIYKLETDGWDLELLISAAQMHDVGKICVGEEILNKPGVLGADEFDEIKKHPTFGLMIIDKIRQIIGEHTFLSYASVIADSHHEHWDGSGYPEGRIGHAIPLAGRLMAIVDVYDALISFRPYKQPMSPDEAAAEIIRCSGTVFDPVLVNVFKTLIGEFAKIAEHRDILI